MPSYVIADMLGIPLEDGVALYGLTEAIHAAPESQEAGAAMRAVLEMFNYARGVWERKRAEPADDLATLIATATVDEHELDVIDFNLFFLLLIDAGGDTTRNLVAGGMDALFDHPDQLAWLRADLDARLPCAVEELLRWVSPVVYMRRTAQRDTELDGVPIAAGQKVVMYYGSANRDPEAFGPTADVLDLARTPNEHVAFGGGGPHFCLGAHIARVEIHALLRELLTRLVDLRPVGRDRVAAVDVHLRPEAPSRRVLRRSTLLKSTRRFAGGCRFRDVRARSGRGAGSRVRRGVRVQLRRRRGLDGTTIDAAH